MRWETIDIDEEQEFLLTKDYLMQRHELLPNDYSIYACNELRATLERTDWHLSMTLTFDSPIYDLHNVTPLSPVARHALTLSRRWQPSATTLTPSTPQPKRIARSGSPMLESGIS
jgi:hypothetical protein